MRFLFGKKKADAIVVTTDEIQLLQQVAPSDPLAVKAAVIALAIHQYRQEKAISERFNLTMHHEVKPYSPWNSKIYGLRQQPIRIPSARPQRALS